MKPCRQLGAELAPPPLSTRRHDPARSRLDVDGPRYCPEEYQAMRAAIADYRALALRFLDGDPAVTEADCLAAKDRVNCAEVAAQRAYERVVRDEKGDREN